MYMYLSVIMVNGVPGEGDPDSSSSASHTIIPIQITPASGQKGIDSRLPHKYGLAACRGSAIRGWSQHGKARQAGLGKGRLRAPFSFVV